MQKIRVLLITDNQLLGEGAIVLLNAVPDIAATAVYRTDAAAVAQARAQKPQIVLLQPGLDNKDSQRIVRMIRTEMPKAEVIVMNLDPQRCDVAALVKEGVAGFTLSGSRFDDLLLALRTVAGGGKVLPPSFVNVLFSQVTEGPVKAVGADGLSRREEQVIEQVALGMSNKQIAVQLRVSVHTVKSHIHNILKKLALNTRLELAHFALTGGHPARSRAVGSQRRPRLNPRD